MTGRDPQGANRLRERLPGRAVADCQGGGGPPARRAELRLRLRLGPARIDVFSFGEAYLGPPRTVHGRRQSGGQDFKVANLAAAGLEARLEDRVDLLSKFDTWRRDGRPGQQYRRHGRVQSPAGHGTDHQPTTPAGRSTWSLSRQRARSLRPARLRPAGLLARRLVEAGCTFVTMVLENPMPGRAAAPTT